MGFRFRKSIKILPGIKVNLTEKGVSSASIGKRGANINIGKKGTRTTVGIPGSGLSYSKYKAYDDKFERASNTEQNVEQPNSPPESPANQSPISALFSTGTIVMIVIIAFVLGAIIF